MPQYFECQCGTVWTHLDIYLPLFILLVRFSFCLFVIISFSDSWNTLSAHILSVISQRLREAYQSEHLTSPPTGSPRSSKAQIRREQSDIKPLLTAAYTHHSALCQQQHRAFGCLFVYLFCAACGVSILSCISTAVEICQTDWRGHVKNFTSVEMMLLKILPFTDGSWDYALFGIRELSNT